MATILWPTELGNFLYRGYALEPEDSREIFKMRAGPPIVHSPVTAEDEIHRVTMVWRDRQFELLQAWYEASASASPPGLGGGVQPFEWTDPDSRGLVHDFMFEQKPRVSRLAGAAETRFEAVGSTGNFLAFGITDAGLQRLLEVTFALRESAHFVVL